MKILKQSEHQHNSEIRINIFIQARMSSYRFPAKVLAPVNGTPLIKHLIDNTRKIKNSKIIVLTSREPSDEPLVAFLKSINCDIFRGDLDNVFRRFYDALDVYPCDYFVRLCADSPFVNPALIEFMINNIFDKNYDLISNVFSRKFPKGQSVEILKSTVFKAVQDHDLSLEEKEHVMPYFYKNRDQYRCLFLENAKDLSEMNYCIDTLEDLRKIEGKIQENKYIFNESEICTLES